MDEINTTEDFHLQSGCVVLQQYTPKSQVGLSEELRNVIDQKNILTARTRKKVLLDLDEINTENFEKDNEPHRIRIIKEIFTSEKSYLAQLDLIKNFFMKPIKERSLLTEDEYQLLFRNIETIYNISKELLSELKNEQIASVFSKIAPFLKLYSMYAYDYKRALKMLQICHRNSDFSKFMEMQESRPEVQTKLSALLITPIQRVPRYCLLLKQLLNHTSPLHPSYTLLRASLKNVEVAAVHINNLVKEQENSQRLLELQLSLRNRYPSIIKPDRKLIKAGILMKMDLNSNRSKKRYFVLFNDILMDCKLKKDNPDSINSLKCAGILPLNKCKITRSLYKGVLKITCENETIIVYHHQAHIIEEWSEILEKSIRKYLKNRRTLRKGSSARRPVKKKFVGEYQDLGISPGQPRRKRLIKHKNVNHTPTNLEDSDPATKSCFSLRATKRKAIGNSEQAESTPKKFKTEEIDEVRDSLFPLREHLGEPNSADSPAINENGVFVFGQNHVPRNFRFTWSNILTSLGNSVKRLFGFKNN